MISWIILLLSTLTAVGALVATRKKYNEVVTEDRHGDRHTTSNPKWLVLPVVIFVIGLLVALFQPYALDRVDAGHVGIKVRLTGDSRGVSNYSYKTGWVIYNTWTEQLYEFPTYQQHIEYKDQHVITKGGFSATIRPSFNYSLIPTAVGDMFQNLRREISEVEQGWLKNAIISSVNDVANRWAVDDIFNKREEFESAIIVECNKRVSKWFTVSQLRTNITPPPSLQASIEAKTKAIQDAQAKIQEALVADANAKKQIAVARGDSAKAVITASGEANATLITARAEAEAVKVKQREITPLYVDYLKVTRWNGVNPTTVLGNNSSTLVTVK